MTGLEPAFDSALCDRALSALGFAAPSWAATELTERIALLERVPPRVIERAEAMVAASAAAKGYGADSPWAAEDWAGAPWALVQNIHAMLRVMRRLAAGRPALPPGAVARREGRTWVDVFPASGWDRLLLSGYRASVRMLPGYREAQVRATAGGAYTGRDRRPGVALVLGAGNVAAITALDVLHKLYLEGQVVVAKMNPVNAYLRPHFEYVFGEFVERGYLRFVDGGAAEGAYLAAHPALGSIHVTGSARTHDAIVFGTGADAEQRRREDRPILDKPLTSELGGVSPCIVAPGPWSAADFRFQAEHIVTGKMNNSGHNCIATQILVLPARWEGTDKLLTEIRSVLRSLPERPDYYPGAHARIDTVRAAHPDAEQLAGDGTGAPRRLLVDHLATDGTDPLLTDEVFASVLGIVRLPGASASEFLANAVDFANDVLPGTLGATLVLHPRTERDHRPAVRAAVDRLRYGTLGVNCWPGRRIPARIHPVGRPPRPHPSGDRERDRVRAQRLLPGRGREDGPARPVRPRAARTAHRLALALAAAAVLRHPPDRRRHHAAPGALHRRAEPARAARDLRLRPARLRRSHRKKPQEGDQPSSKVAGQRGTVIGATPKIRDGGPADNITARSDHVLTDPFTRRRTRRGAPTRPHPNHLDRLNGDSRMPDTPRVLVIGATGYLGRHVARAFADDGHDVSALQRPGGRPVDPRYRPVPGDLADPASLRAAAEGFDLVVQAGRIEGEVEREGAEAIMASGARLIHTSGADVLGPGRSHEDTVPRPPRCVAWRAPVEQAVRAGGGILIRPGLIYGEGGGVVPVQMLPVHARLGAGLYFERRGVRWPAVHVADLADLYLLVARKAAPGTAWNGVAEIITVDELAEATGLGPAICRPTIDNAPPEFAEIAELWVMDHEVDAARTRHEMGWEPRHLGAIDYLRAESAPVLRRLSGTGAREH